MSTISKPRLKSAVIRQNETTSSYKLLKGTINASQPLDSNTFTKGSPKNGQNTNKVIPLLSSNITNATKTTLNSYTTTSTTTTTTKLPQTSLLKIEPFVPSPSTARLQKPIRRSYSTLSNTTLRKRTIHNVNKKIEHNLDLASVGGGGRGEKGGLKGATANIVNGLPKVLKQPTTNPRRRPNIRGNINRQRSKSTSSSNSNSNRPNTSAVTLINSTPSLGTPCSSPYSAVVIQQPNGICRITRNVKVQEELPDRINYDKRGLTAIPIFENETNLRLLSLQHNLINTFHIPQDQGDIGKIEVEYRDIVKEEKPDHKPEMETINLIANNHYYGLQTTKQRLPLALSTPNVEQLQMQFHPPSQVATSLTLQKSTTLGFTTYTSLQRNKLMQRTNLQTKTMLPQQNHLRFGMRKSQSFINNFNLQLNLDNRVLQNQRTLILRKSQGGQGNLKSFDSSTSNTTTDSTNSKLLTTEIVDAVEVQQQLGVEGEEEEDERLNSLAEMEIKNKQLIINYGTIFQSLVFLDLYDNQIEKISNLDGLPCLTVLLLGKNRISDLSGLSSLKSSLKVLDLHGNKLCSIANKINCLKELKSLNLAGNQIRQINHNDFLGLHNLKELNLKRNKLKRINGFQHLNSLERLWLCHNELYKVDDMSTIAKACNLIEITIENNPLTLAGDCVSFLVSYLPKLQTLSQMPITEQVRKAAMTWRSNKELSEANLQHTTNKEVFNIIRREEIISNARTNWELLRSQQMVQSSLKQQKLTKPCNELEKITEANEHNYEEFIKLPPIEHQQQAKSCITTSCNQKSEERSSSASSLGPNGNSSSSCYSSQDEEVDNNSECPSKDLNIKHSSTVKSKQQTDNNTNQTSTDNNHHHHNHQSLYSHPQSKCNPATIRTPSLATTSGCAPTLNLQFPVENNKVSANQQNQTNISNATSVSSLTCSTQQTAAATASVPSTSNSLSSASVTQASTYCKRYMTGSLMRSQTIVGTVTGATSGNGTRVGVGGCGSTSGYTVKTNTITTANNIRYQSKLNTNTGNTQTSAVLAAHQQTMTTTMMSTTGNNAAITTNSNNLISSSSSSSSMYGHNKSLTLNSNKTSTMTTTTIANATTAGSYGASCGGGGGATTTKLTAIEREREQGGDYLIEICGRYLNIYGQGALRFIEKQWNPTKANDVHTLNFSYINFNNIASIMGRIKVRFSHAENFVFRETNINSLGQLNALAELQGISSLTIDIKGNPITGKDLWRQYAIYRLSHWGLKVLNSIEVTDMEIEKSNQLYAGLSDLILWSMPDTMLQPLLARLRLDESCTASKMLPKQWLHKPDNKSLRLVVGKEALQWKKSNNQELHQQLPTPQQVRQLQNQYYYNNCNNNVDCTNTSNQQQSITIAAGTSSTSMLSSLPSSSTATSLTTRERGKIHFTLMMENTCNAVEKLHKLEQLWPTMLLNIVRNTLLDYTQLDVYIRNLMAEIMK